MKKAIVCGIAILFICTSVVQVQILHADEVGSKWALILGTNYEGSSVSSLTLCESDASYLYQTLIEECGIPQSQARLITGSQVTKENIRTQMRSFLAQAKRNDTVFLYFSGHGGYTKDSRAPNGVAHIIWMYDAEYLTDSEIADLLNTCAAQNICFMFDACHSGGIAANIADMPIPEGQSAAVYTDLEPITIRNRVIISSSDANEVSWEMSNLGHGVFTYYIGDAVAHTGDINNDGIITGEEAYLVTRRRVIETVKTYIGKDQHPTASGDIKRLVFKSSGIPLPAHTVVSEPAPAVTAELPAHAVVSESAPAVTAEPPAHAVVSASNIQISDENSTITVLPLKKGELIIYTTHTDNPTVSLNGTIVPVHWSAAHNDRLGACKKTVLSYKTGMYDLMLSLSGYNEYRESIVIEDNKKTEVHAAVCKKRKGMIVGRVYKMNFGTPLSGGEIYLFQKKGRRTFDTDFTVHADENGRFVFNNLNPGTYMIMYVGSVLKTEKIDIKVSKGTSTEIDIVLKEAVKHNRLDNMFDKLNNMDF